VSFSGMGFACSRDQSIISKNRLKRSCKESAAEDNFMTSKVSSFC